eukprot:UN18218
MADDSHPAGWISADAISLSKLIRQGISQSPCRFAQGAPAVAVPRMDFGHSI